MMLGPLIIAGAMSLYGLGPTVGTLEMRQEWGQIPENLQSYDVFVAVADCNQIGREGTLIYDGDLYNALVFDCSGDLQTTDWMGCDMADHRHECRVAFEVDHWFGEENAGLVGQEAVLVLSGEKV